MFVFQVQKEIFVVFDFVVTVIFELFEHEQTCIAVFFCTSHLYLLMLLLYMNFSGKALFLLFNFVSIEGRVSF